MKLSIITINYNNCLGLSKTMNSVIHQTYKDFEYIVIDGNSTDGSVDVIKKNSDKLSYWISEPDIGIYNAMNKGIKIAKGEYLLFLNSGDVLVNEHILENVNNELKDEPIIYGNGILETKEGKQIKMDIPETLSLEYFSGASLFHPSAFIRKDLFKTYGLYNEGNQIVSDWEFFLKTIIIHKVNAKKIPFAIAVIEDEGISRKKENFSLVMEEIEKGLKRYFPDPVLNSLKKNKNVDSLVSEVKSSVFKRMLDKYRKEKN